MSELRSEARKEAKAIRIAFVGNVNSMPFRYAYELRKMGVDVAFYVDCDRDHKLHRPEARFPEIAYPYPEWIKEIHPPRHELGFLFPTKALRRLVKELNSGCHDAIVLNGVWHKLAPSLQRDIKIVALFSGTDLDVLANYGWVRKAQYSHNAIVNGGKKALRYLGVWQHRRGIRRASLINYYPEGVTPSGDELIRSIMGKKDFIRMQIRGITVEDVRYIEPSMRVGSNVVLFNPTRFLWKEPLPEGYGPEENKRNDIMLRGVAEFYRRTGIGPRLILVEKGAQLHETKELIATLGIGRLVHWCAEMSQREIFRCYAEADIVFEQLGNHWVGAAGLDAMLTGRPVIANGRQEVFKKILGETFPVCQAATEFEVADWLERLVNNPVLRKQIGQQSREFVVRHFDAKKTAREFLNFAGNLKGGPSESSSTAQDQAPCS